MGFLDTKEESRDLLGSKLGEYSERISEQVERVAVNTDRYQMYAQRLGLSWNTEISNKGLEEMQDEIYIEMARMLDSAEDPAIYKGVNDYISYAVSQIEKSAEEYNDVNFEKQVRKEINAKVEGILKQAQIDDIDKEIMNLKSAKTGFFGRILGRDRENELKREHLALIKGLLQSDSENGDEDCNVNEIMAKMLYYKKQHNGNLPTELYVIASQITSVFKIDETEVKEIVDRKCNSQLPTVQNTTNSIFRRKSNRILQEQNRRLEEELQIAKEKNSNPFRVQTKPNKNVVDNLREIYYHMKNIQDAIKQRMDEARDSKNTVQPEQ